MTTMNERVQGVLLGLAAGDRNGGPIRMALRLAASLAERQSFDSEDILDCYLVWWNQDGFDTGPTAADVFASIMRGVPRSEAAERVHVAHRSMTAGCNPAHRAAPLAMLASLADGDLSSCARSEGRLTHWHSLAGDVSAAVVVLCRALIKGAAWAEALQIAGAQQEPQVLAALNVHIPQPLYPDGFAPNVLCAAVHFLDQHRRFSDALDASIEFAGPANYCPVLVGAIGGARWGIPPPEHLAHCDVLDEAQSLAIQLAESWSA